MAGSGGKFNPRHCILSIGSREIGGKQITEWHPAGVGHACEMRSMRDEGESHEAKEGNHAGFTSQGSHVVAVCLFPFPRSDSKQLSALLKGQGMAALLVVGVLWAGKTLHGKIEDCRSPLVLLEPPPSITSDSASSDTCLSTPVHRRRRGRKNRDPTPGPSGLSHRQLQSLLRRWDRRQALLNYRRSRCPVRVSDLEPLEAAIDEASLMCSLLEAADFWLRQAGLRKAGIR
jgi:hypothetical protein